MTDQDVVVVIGGDADTCAVVSAALPSTVVCTLEDVAANDNVPTNLWCFVDWLLPEISGLEMVRQLREGPPTLRSHITLVLDEDSAEMRRRALRAGADDYLPGPFSAAGILERLQRYKIGRGATTGAPPRIASGELIVDQEAHRVRWRGQRVALSPGEFQLLAHFLQNPDRLFTRSGLITALGKADHMVDKRTVDVWIGRLRRSLVAQGVPDRLRTVRAMGYVFDSLEQDMGSSRES